jgi:hypothetical protein
MRLPSALGAVLTVLISAGIGIVTNLITSNWTWTMGVALTVLVLIAAALALASRPAEPPAPGGGSRVVQDATNGALIRRSPIKAVNSDITQKADDATISDSGIDAH